jgi:hypothetical protein
MWAEVILILCVDTVMADLSTRELQRRIAELAPSLHCAGTFSTRALDRIASHAATRNIRRSAETGSGATTLLMSHLSEHHWVFALDDGNGSVANVKRCSLLRADHVEFVEGPTQCTLPQFRFTEKLQFALIDGPHAYPFPDLEYYYLYPHLESGALFVLDDIHIRSIQNLFQFLRCDRMFHLEEVVGSTAIFTRTDTPTFDPRGDGWWLQEYNRKLLKRYTWKQTVRSFLTERLRRLASQFRHQQGRWRVEITSPESGETVGGSGNVTGYADLPAHSHLWVLARRKDISGWWPQGGGPLPLDSGRWSAHVQYGESGDAGRDFEIVALAVDEVINDLWTTWWKNVQTTGKYPPVQLPKPQFVFAETYRTVRRSI